MVCDHRKQRCFFLQVRGTASEKIVEIQKGEKSFAEHKTLALFNLCDIMTSFPLSFNLQKECCGIIFT